MRMAVDCLKGCRMSDLKENLKQSLALIEAPSNVIDLDVERADRREISNRDVTPETVLKMALRECEKSGNVTQCYITLVEDTPEGMSTTNLRSNMSRIEEIAYRQLGLAEAIEQYYQAAGKET